MKGIYCKNCNEEVAYASISCEWFHVATYNTQCHPFGAYTNPTYAEPESETEISVESDYGSENGSEQKMGPNYGSVEYGSGDAVPSPPDGRGLVDLLTSLYPSITNLTLPVHQKLKAYDAINTLLKIATQAEARLGFEEAPTQDDVYNYPYYEG